MPFNGAGVYAPPGADYPVVTLTTIESAKYNDLVADLATALTLCITKDGQQVTTARVPFASGIQTDTVTEFSSSAGVTLDSVLLKDGRVDTTQGADIASAGTLVLESATGNLVDVTGTTTITAITLSQGHQRLVRFTGALTLTHGASLVLPGAVNITTAAGDFALFEGYAAGVVRCAAYITAASSPLGTTGTATHKGPLDLSAAAAGQILFPAAQNASAGANTLDDYEEGTWTPTVGGTATYNLRAGLYTKVGRMVAVQMTLAINAIGSGSATVAGTLPFTATGTDRYAMAVGRWTNTVNNLTYLGVELVGTGLNMNGGLAATNTLGAGVNVMGSNTEIYGSGVFFV